MRNFLYPAAIFASIATIWLIGWASSIEARANVGYWSATNDRTVSHRNVDPETGSNPETADNPERQAPVASISDGNN